MRVEFYTMDDWAEWLHAGCDEIEAKRLAKLFGFLTIELDRVPDVGENITLVKGDYFVSAYVQRVSTNWVEPGNAHIKETAYGAEYGITLRDLEVLEHYAQRTPIREKAQRNEVKIGEKVTSPIDGKPLIAVEDIDREDCIGCALYASAFDCRLPFGYCDGERRKDGKDILFKQVEN